MGRLGCRWNSNSRPSLSSTGSTDRTCHLESALKGVDQRIPPRPASSTRLPHDAVTSQVPFVVSEMQSMFSIAPSEVCLHSA